MTDSAMQKLVDAAGRTFDRKKRTALLYELQKRFWTHSGYILPTTADVLDAVAKNVNGIAPTPLINLGGGNFRPVWKS
jgi:ABC-type transport system substrate-binding protein